MQNLHPLDFTTKPDQYKMEEIRVPRSGRGYSKMRESEEGKERRKREEGRNPLWVWFKEGNRRLAYM